jgi:outer membrane cobalamin receptor
MRKKIPTVLVFLLLSLPLYVFGEDKDVLRYNLNPIIVTATKIPQQEENVTQKVDIIEREEFPNIATIMVTLQSFLPTSPGHL